MRITRDLLLKAARDAAAEEVRRDRQVVCIYLTGSLLLDDPLLGGTTDIDLMVVHSGDPTVSREVRRVTDEVTLDIAHLSQAVFVQPRHLRLDPWLGSYLVRNPLRLYDIQHWFEFNQASVQGQFNQPEYILRRARPQAEDARQIWMDLHNNAGLPIQQRVQSYLDALKKSANAIATLTGAPLTERRFMLNFPERAAAIERPGLAAGLVDLLSPLELPAEAWETWLQSWVGALTAIGKRPSCPVRLHPSRLPYYFRAADALREEHPAAALWLILRTWTLAIHHLPTDSAEFQAWETACAEINLDDAHFSDRLDGLDVYLDAVEETLDQWAEQNGIGIPA